MACGVIMFCEQEVKYGQSVHISDLKFEVASFSNARGMFLFWTCRFYIRVIVLQFVFVVFLLLACCETMTVVCGYVASNYGNLVYSFSEHDVSNSLTRVIHQSIV